MIIKLSNVEHKPAVNLEESIFPPLDKSLGDNLDIN